METHIPGKGDWDIIRAAIEKEDLDDPRTFSSLLRSYLDKVERLHSSYTTFCKSIFSPG